MHDRAFGFRDEQTRKPGRLGIPSRRAARTKLWALQRPGTENTVAGTPIRTGASAPVPGPASASTTEARIPTERARIPGWSSVQLSGTMPALGSRPRVGFNPTSPQ